MTFLHVYVRTYVRTTTLPYSKNSTTVHDMHVHRRQTSLRITTNTTMRVSCLQLMLHQTLRSYFHQITHNKTCPIRHGTRVSVRTVRLYVRTLEYVLLLLLLLLLSFPSSVGCSNALTVTHSLTYSLTPLCLSLRDLLLGINQAAVASE